MKSHTSTIVYATSRLISLRTGEKIVVKPAIPAMPRRYPGDTRCMYRTETNLSNIDGKISISRLMWECREQNEEGVDPRKKGIH